MGIARFRKQNMADEDYSVEGAADAGAAHTQPMEAGQIRKGGFIMIKGNPCKVVDVSTSKTGKHGHAKCHFVAINIFNGKKAEELCPASHNAQVPFVTRKEYQVMSVDDAPYVSLMDPDGECREDLQFPSGTSDDKDVSQKLIEYIEAGDCDVMVTVLSACGNEKIVDVKKTNAD